MNNIVGIGANVFDTLITVDNFPTEDTKLRATKTITCGGGPAATAIVAAAKLGISCGFIGVLTDDIGGKYLYNDFINYGVDTTYIEIKSGYRSFTSYVLLSTQTKSRTCIFDKGTVPPLVLNDGQKVAIRNAKVFMADGNDLSAAITAAEVAKQSNTAVLCDAGGEYEGINKLLRLTDILIPSKEFALSHTKSLDIKMAAKKLFAGYLPRVVVITCGKEGGLLFDGYDFYEYPTYPADVVDSNGAGDVFHGAFAAAYSKGYSFKQCCHFASAVSALKCMNFGARESVPSFHDTIQFLRRNGYDEL